MFDRIQADALAIGSSIGDLSLQSQLLRLGLSARSFIDMATFGLINFNNKGELYTPEMGDSLQHMIDYGN